MKKEIKIGSRTVGKGHPTYVIAEIGTNHNQDLNLALDMISMVKESGADAAKFQSIQFSELYIEALETTDFREWFRQIELEESWYEALAKRCAQEGIDFLSSPTYESAIGLLEKVNVPAYKLASPQVQANLKVVERAAKTMKPLILSVGYCGYGDIVRAVNLCKSVGNDSLILLHCNSKYPVKAEESNLMFIQTLAAMTNELTGYSDHSMGTHFGVAAVSLGACIIEKHVTTDRNQKGPDHPFALTFKEFKDMTEQIREVQLGLGSGARLHLLPEELESRRKVELKAISKKPIKAGETISDENMIFYRSAQSGVSIDYIELLKNTRSKQDIEGGSLIQWKMLEHI
ncbi:hypothetical protein A0128_07435 [Leptospira tipperaryensis]|uniref:AFP-like domain-containing protein n=1 Tax=Leptospira tipperaryensis TaxID=2564040 RepID=A0A1D7UVR1_9LEPT|nr:N-acetylneuraminate synthase family protein [Leptospira tipperaryensis]AOP33689.1 hypothetical protein A0128_07435 [Leptospira tipperaryensis]